MHKNLKQIGLKCNPNEIGRERRMRYNRLRTMYRAKDGKGSIDETSKPQRHKPGYDDNFDYNPMDMNSFIDAGNDNGGKNPLMLGIPKSLLAHRLNTALNTKPSNQFKSLPRHKREYYQRLIIAHGSDFRAMANDIQRNFFQWTENRIKKDIRHFQYEFKWPKQRDIVML